MKNKKIIQPMKGRTVFTSSFHVTWVEVWPGNGGKLGDGRSVWTGTPSMVRALERSMPSTVTRSIPRTSMESRALTSTWSRVSPSKLSMDS